MFHPALITDIPLQRDEDPSGVSSKSLLPESATSAATSQQLNDEALFATITPYSKVNFAKNAPIKTDLKVQ